MDPMFWGYLCLFYVALLAATLIARWVWVRVKAVHRIRQAEKLVRKHSIK